MTDAPQLAALPFHIFARTSSEVVLTRGTTCVRLEGDGVLARLRFVCQRFGEAHRSAAEIVEAAAAEHRQQVAQILELLLERRLVIEACAEYPGLLGLESPLDLFNWHFGREALRPEEGFTHHSIAVVGMNHLSAVLLPALGAAGFGDVTLVDDPFLRRPTPGAAHEVAVDPTAWVADGLATAEVVIACSDGGSSSILREWNALCVRRGVAFFPLLLRRMVGLIGPLVLPGDTACFECTVRREPEGPELAADIEAIEVESSRAGVAAFHPSMAAVVAHFAVMELVKFLGNIPAATAGVLFDVNLLRPELVSRRILRVPGCPICSSINTVPVHCVVDVARQR